MNDIEFLALLAEEMEYENPDVTADKVREAFARIFEDPSYDDDGVDMGELVDEETNLLY